MRFPFDQGAGRAGSVQRSGVTGIAARRESRGRSGSLRSRRLLALRGAPIAGNRIGARPRAVSTRAVWTSYSRGAAGARA